MTEKPEDYEPIPSIESSSETPEEGPEQPTGETTTALTPYDQMAAEWELPWAEQKLLIHPPEGGVLLDSHVAQIRSASKRYSIPLSGFNLIDVRGVKNLYINADGMNFRLHTDPRGLKSIETSLEHMPDVDKESDYVAVKAIITMGDSTHYDGWGVNEWPPGKRNATLGLGDLTMKLETKAVRRATIKAVGKGIPVLDDDWRSWVAGPGKDIIEGEVTELLPKKPKKERPTNLAELLSMAQGVDESLKANRLVEMMGLNAITELGEHVDDAWERILEYEQAGGVSGSDTGKAKDQEA